MADTRTIAIPESVLPSAQSLDDLEDWLAANDPDFLERLRRIRRDEDLAGLCRYRVGQHRILYGVYADRGPTHHERGRTQTLNFEESR